jgi:hypothetical protein
MSLDEYPSQERKRRMEYLLARHRSAERLRRALDALAAAEGKPPPLHDWPDGWYLDKGKDPAPRG